MGTVLSNLGRDWAGASLNPLTQALETRRQEGRGWLDLVTANPHEHDLEFPSDLVGDILGRVAGKARIYRPDPLGQRPARQAVADYYGRQGFSIDPDEIILTPGTSLAYLYLFKVLLNPRDEVLVPWPGYPLFEDIARLADIRIRYYYLRPGWSLDLEDLAFQCTPRTRMLVVVSPHNPLGLVVPDWSGVTAICRAHDLSLVVDEVFCEFMVRGSYVRPPRVERLFILNGLSKMLSLPGVKLGWILGTSGLGALEYVSDVFLPVSEWVQAAAPEILEAGVHVARRLAQEYRIRRRVLERHLPVLPADAGVYACLPLPEGVDEDEFVLTALDKADVLVHPGHFYHLPQHVVMTCVARCEMLEEGALRLARLLPGS
ncbi:MAG TPA: pyridoxal phosphate-dependent aminotransferase [Candidatus Xenobia bacterium]|jgi:hypothetical protein